MKKILTLIGTISIVSSGISTVVSCDNNNSSGNSKTSKESEINSYYNPMNLSTWGDKQKTIIQNAYLNYARNWKPLDYYVRPVSKTWKRWTSQSLQRSDNDVPDELAMNAGGKTIAVLFNAWDRYQRSDTNIYFQQNDKDGKILANDNTNLLSVILKQGIYLYLVGYKEMTGNTSIFIQGDIS